MKRRLLRTALGLCLVLSVGSGIAAFRLPDVGAAMLLHPLRKPVPANAPDGFSRVAFAGVGVRLEGWKGMAAGRARGTVIYLHGLSDNRVSGVGMLRRYMGRGFDVITYDSRAHGQSGGDVCTYGWFEKKDLLAVVESIEHPPAILIGCSLGAAVAIQAAALDEKRIATVVAAETFSDLRTVADERAPFIFNAGTKAKAFRVAEEKGGFSMDEVSPLKDASKIHIPVLLIHGEADVDTPAEHSRRVFRLLGGEKRLILVPGARHGQSLGGDVWKEVDSWIDRHLPGRSG